MCEWTEWSRYILNSIKNISSATKKLDENISTLKSEIAVLKVRNESVTHLETIVDTLETEIASLKTNLAVQKVKIGALISCLTIGVTLLTNLGIKLLT